MADCLKLMLSAVHIKSVDKFFDVTKAHKILQLYLASKEVNIRGHAFLVIANIAKLDSSFGNPNMSFTTLDVKLLISTYMTYESEGAHMGDFLAKTNFPELCVQEIRNGLIRDPGNEVIQVSHHLMNMFAK